MLGSVNLYVGRFVLSFRRTDTGTIWIQIDDPSIPGAPQLPTRELEGWIWAALVAELAAEKEPETDGH